MSEPPTKTRRFLTESIINAVDNAKVYVKLTITQEEVSIVFSTTYIEASLSETLNTSETSSNKDRPHKRSDNID